MNKATIIAQVIAALEQQVLDARSAAQQAYESATHEENIAENKYDTLGLEASYLAEGQSRRVAECEQALATFKSLGCPLFEEDDAIQVGALVQLLGLNSGAQRWVLLSPVAGGTQVSMDSFSMQLVTPQAPLGKGIMGHYVEDEVCIGPAQNFQINAVC